MVLRRYKRFFADVRLDDGRELTVFCPNPGSMRTCIGPGWRCRVSDSENPARKLRYTLEMTHNGRCWIGVNTALPNCLMEAALAAGRIPELNGYASVRREVALPGEARSRIDFLLENPAGRSARPSQKRGVGAQGKAGAGARLWLEIKGVSMMEGGVFQFPDSRTERGRRHVEELMEMARSGERAMLYFLVLRSDARILRPADAIDPRFGEALREAARAGVELQARRVSWRRGGATIGAQVALDLQLQSF